MYGYSGGVRVGEGRGELPAVAERGVRTIRCHGSEVEWRGGARMPIVAKPEFVVYRVLCGWDGGWGRRRGGGGGMGRGEAR